MSEEPLMKWESVTAAIEDGETKYIGEKTEWGRVVRANGSQVFPDVKGFETEVRFTKQQQGQMKGCNVFHNHPSGSSLSEDDVHLAVSTGVGKIFASGKNPFGITYRYELTEPIGGWPDSPIDRKRLAGKVKRDYIREIRKLKEESLADIYWGRISEDEFLANLNHEAMKRLAHRYGFFYSRTCLG